MSVAVEKHKALYITHVGLCQILQQTEKLKTVVEVFLRCIYSLLLHFLASNFFGSLSIGVDLSKNSLAALSCNVPPHFSPRD